MVTESKNGWSMNLVDLRVTKRDLKAEAMQLVSNGILSKRELTAEEQGRFDRIILEVAELDKRISKLEDIENGPVQDDEMSDFDTRSKSHRSRGGYSILRVIRSLIDGGQLNGVEAEAHQELTRRMGRTASRGVFVPFNYRALDTTTGAGALDINVQSTYIKKLRNASILDKLGVTWMNNLRGKVRIPRQTGSGNVFWMAEGSNIAPTNFVTDYVQLEPKTVGAVTSYTRKFLHESAIDVERFIEDDFTKGVAREIDRAFLDGSGVGAEPLGLFSQSGLSILSSGTNGGPLSWSNVVGLESAVLERNGVVNESACKYLTSAVGQKASKTVTKDASGTYPIFLYEEVNRSLNSYPLVQSNVVPSNLTKGTGTDLTAMLFGDWSQGIVGSWGAGFELIVDPYSRADFGEVRLIALHDVDVAFRQIESFSAIVDMA